MTQQEADSKLTELLTPPPLFTVKNGDDMELLKSFAHREIIEKTIADAGGDMEKFAVEFARRAEKARIKQGEVK